MTRSEYIDAIKKITDEYKNQSKKKTCRFYRHYKHPSEAKLNDHLYDFEFKNKTRIYNAIAGNAEELNLNSAFNLKVKDLKKISKNKFLKCRNVGYGMIIDLETFCIQAGINMKD